MLIRLELINKHWPSIQLFSIIFVWVDVTIVVSEGSVGVSEISVFKLVLISVGSFGISEIIVLESVLLLLFIFSGSFPYLLLEDYL